MRLLIFFFQAMLSVAIRRHEEAKEYLALQNERVSQKKKKN